MDIGKYRALLRTVEMGNITRAAEELGYTQSAVSRIIADLEQEWGVTLLTRGRMGVVLSSAGEALLPHLCLLYTSNTTTAKHDAIIAYTSQVMHIMAVAVCDDPDLFDCKGFEGGSFRDCTRVAALDVPLWTELFSMNAPALCKVIRNLEDNLRAYREVIASGDTAALAEKLAWSADRKRHMNLE